MNWVDFADAFWYIGATLAGGFLVYGAWLCAEKRPASTTPRSSGARQLDGSSVAAAREG